MYQLVFRLLSVGLLYLYEVNCHLSMLLKVFLVCDFFKLYLKFVSAILIQTLPLLVHCITLCNLHSVKILAACPM